MEDKKIETIDVSELVEGKNIFESKGSSLLRVTYNGKKTNLRIPIKSSGVSSLIDELSKNKPQPPGKKCLVEPNTEIARDLGILKKQWVWLSDYTDPDYIKNKEKHDSNLGLMIVLQGLDMPIKGKEGKVIEDNDKKIEILKSMGLTGEHFSKLVDDISSLTRWQEGEENDFLEQ